MRSVLSSARQRDGWMCALAVALGCSAAAMAGTGGAIVGWLACGRPDFYFRSLEAALTVDAPVWAVLGFVVGLAPGMIVGIVCGMRGRMLRFRSFFMWSIIIGCVINGGLKIVQIKTEGWGLGMWMPDAATFILVTIAALRCTAAIPVSCCPECNYDLRGNVDGGCPECGWGRE